MKYLILYHANCNDGVWSAWAALQAIDLQGGEDSVECLGVYYNKPLPDQAWEVAQDGGVIFIVDFSYPRADLVALQDAGAALVQVIDHHETAMNQLSGFHDAIFDMNRSGAVLTWEAFSSGRVESHSGVLAKSSKIYGQPVPKLLEYVQDRDLWRHELPWTREVYSAMSSFGWMNTQPEYLDKTVRVDTGYEPTDPKLVEQLIDLGKPAFRRRMEEVRAIVQGHQYWVNLGDGLVPIVEAQKYWSDVANMLCHIYLDAPYAVCWRCDRNGDAVLDLRSLGFPVNAIAKNLGGGGHRKAAGCPIPSALLSPEAEASAEHPAHQPPLALYDRDGETIAVLRRDGVVIPVDADGRPG